jgi:polar amino acid transport system substrate-binding protein
MDAIKSHRSQEIRVSVAGAYALFSGVRRAASKVCHLGVAILGAVALVGAMAVTPAQADKLSDVKKAGVVKFGVKADVKPWAYVDSAGNPVGFEIDMANEIAKMLGVKADFTTVTSANRIQYLQQGKIDIILATLSDTEKRRKIIKMVHPNYFGDATNILAPKGTKIKKWADLKDSVLCGVRGAFYNKPYAKKFNAEIKAFKGPPEAIAAMKQGQCQAFIFADQILRIQQENDPTLNDYTVPLDPRDVDLWALAVNLGDKDASLAKLLSGVIKSLHKSGKLLEMAKPHGLGGNPFLKANANK